MIRTAIFAGATVSGLMACGRPDAAEDQNSKPAIGETPPAAGAPTVAQQILEVDTNAGRQVAGGEEYSFDHAVVDYDRRLVLASEAGDPLAVTAYSLDDDSVRHVLGGGRGDGPGELMYLAAIAVGPEGVFAAGRHRVLYWSWSGVLRHQWTPTAPNTRRLCALDGRPAVALQEGVALRGDDGETVAIGGEARTSLNLGAFRSLSEVSESAVDAVVDRYYTVQLACADSLAYVLTGMVHSLVKYQQGAEPRTIAMPPELVEAARWRMEVDEWKNTGYSSLFLAADGRLVVTTNNTRVAGALLDRATGCWTLLKENPLTSFVRYVGMFGDSVVTAERSREPMETRTMDGRRVPVFSSDNKRSKRLRCTRRNSLIVVKCGSALPVSTRNATCSRHARAMRRDEYTPELYAYTSNATIILGSYGRWPRASFA